MTLMKSGKGRIMSVMAIRAAVSLCMAVMIVGCSSAGGTAKPMVQDKTGERDIQLHDCSPEEKHAILEQANKEAGSEGSRWLKRQPSRAASFGLSWIPVIGPFLAGANDARQETQEWTQSSSQKWIDVLAGAMCDNHGNYVPSDTAKNMDKVNNVVNPLR